MRGKRKKYIWGEDNNLIIFVGVKQKQGWVHNATKYNKGD